MNKQIIMDLRARLNRSAAEALIELFERVEKLEKAQNSKEEPKIEELKEELIEESAGEIE